MSAIFFVQYWKPPYEWRRVGGVVTTHMFTSVVSPPAACGSFHVNIPGSNPPDPNPGTGSSLNSDTVGLASGQTVIFTTTDTRVMLR